MPFSKEKSGHWSTVNELSLSPTVVFAIAGMNPVAVGAMGAKISTLFGFIFSTA